MNKYWLAAIAALTLGFGYGARAADMPLKAPVPVAAPVLPYNWTGFYVGAHVGGLWSHETRDTTAPLVEVISQTGNGRLGGAQVGYDYQLAPYALVGVEGSFSDAGLSTTKRSVVSLSSLYVTDVHWLATATVRAGYVAGPWLFYGRAGYAATEVTFTGLETAAGDIVRVGGTRGGWTAGVGVEYLVTRNSSVGVEYSHFDFSSQHYTSRTQVFGFPLNADVALDFDRVILRANYRFGG